MQRVGIVGHAGYSGAELIRILSHHQHVEPVLMDHRENAQVPAMRWQHSPARIPATAARAEGLASSSGHPARSPHGTDTWSAGPEPVVDSAAHSACAPKNQTWYKEPTPSPNCWPRPPRLPLNSAGAHFAARLL